MADWAGPCWRAVAAGVEAGFLDGTVRAGRYNRPGQRTLYASGSPAGARAAMARYGDAARTLVQLEVAASGLLDLRTARDDERMAAATDWQAALRDGRTPPSWTVADAARAAGAVGLIEASRHVPALCHLVLFEWNGAGGPTVTVTDARSM